MTTSLPSAFGDPTVVPQLVANHILTSANTYATAQNLPQINTVTTEFLTDAISEITPETQTLGAALLQVALIDPRRVIRRSGICSMDSEGLLYQVDVNYPEGTPVWWRLAMVDWNDSDPSVPDLTMTFQMRIVSYLMDCFGALGWPPGQAGSTRAQFLKMLVDRMPSELPAQSVGPGPPPAIAFICPEINEIQQIDSGTSYGTEVITDAQQASLTAKVNKQPAVTAGTKITAKGQPLNAVQLNSVNTLLGVARGLNSPTQAMVAMIYAAIWESDLLPTATNGSYWGVLSGDVGGWSQTDSTGMATAFLTGKGPEGQTDFHFGADNLVKQGVTDPVTIAERVEGGGSYSGESGYPGDAAAIAEATKIVNAHSGDAILTGAAGVSPSSGQSDVAELTRGTPSNQDEDSWTCMQRLASDVNWFVFASPSAGIVHGQRTWGNYIYFIDGPTLAGQHPALYLELGADGTTWSATDPTTGAVIAGAGVVTSTSGTVDNTAFQYQETKTRKGRVQRKTELRTPQTPSQQQFNMICGVLEFNAGDVIVFHNVGPENGRWIIEDVTHNSLTDVFAQFTLGPPTFPYPEPQADTTTVLGIDGQPVTISTASPASAAKSGSKGGGGVVVAGDVSGYTNPLARLSSLQPLRIDQGVDYAGAGPLLALGNATIVYAANSGTGWPRSPTDADGGAVVYKLLDGVYAGKHVYVAENITTLVSVGQKVNAGDPIATLSDSGDNLETGWASGSGTQTLAAQLGQNAQQTGQDPSDPGGCQSAAGRNFNALLVALGATSGGPGSGPISTGPGMPGNWPVLGKVTKTPSATTSTGKALTTVSTAVSSTIAVITTAEGTGIFSGLFTR